MPARPTLQSLLEQALTQVPALSRQLLDSIHDELQSKPQHFALLPDWRRMRPRFSADFESALIPLLQAARRGEDPLQHKPAAGLDGLSLVDERQALQDVAIAHAISTIEQLSKTELHQLTNFFAALRGTARARANDNPLRPALFAQALHQSMFGVELDAQRRYALMHAATTPLAQSLQRLYESLCGQLREAELTQLVASHASHAQDINARQRLVQARLHNEPATLDRLARRVNAHNSRPQPLTSILSGKSSVGPDMLSRLYDQILADPRLLPPIKALLARLQVAVVRLARGDSNLLRHQDHPAWLLLDRVAAHGMAFERGDDPGLQAFVGFMDGEAQLLIDNPLPSAMLFEQVLSRVEFHLSNQAHERGGRSATALAALEREQQRPQWLALVHEEIEEMIEDAPLGPALREFLLGHWSEVIVQAMVNGGHEAPQVAARVELVDRLLDSLQTPSDDAARSRLRQSLPALMDDLSEGCASIHLPEAARAAMLRELMQQHARVLNGQPALAAPPRPPAPAKETARTAPPKAPPARPASVAPRPHEQVRQLLLERESQQPEDWAHVHVDRGQLPTVPVQLYESSFAHKAVSSWFEGLAVGSWFHLFVQSQWLTAQVAWVSETQQFYLFVGQDAEVRHSLTRGAIEQLLANGLITALAENGVLQQALDTLMSELADGAEDER